MFFDHWTIIDRAAPHAFVVYCDCGWTEEAKDYYAAKCLAHDHRSED